MNPNPTVQVQEWREMAMGHAEVFACSYHNWHKDKTPINSAAFTEARTALLAALSVHPFNQVQEPPNGTLFVLTDDARYAEILQPGEPSLPQSGQIDSETAHVTSASGGNDLQTALPEDRRPSNEWYARMIADEVRLLDECKPYLKDDETPAQCIERNRKDAQAVFLYYSDAHRWRWVRDHWDEINGSHFPAGAQHPAWTRPNDPAKLTAYVDGKLSPLPPGELAEARVEPIAGQKP